MQLVEYKPLLPTRRDLVARIFRQRTVFVACLLLVIAGFIVTGQFQPKYQAEMKILVRKERVDPVVTTDQNSTPELQTMSVREEDLNSQVEILKGEDLLRDVVVQAGLTQGNNDPIAVAKAVRKLERHLDVSALTKTDLISIRYESANPEQSRRVSGNARIPVSEQTAQRSRPRLSGFTSFRSRSGSTAPLSRRPKQNCSSSRKGRVLYLPTSSAI